MNASLAAAVKEVLTEIREFLVLAALEKSRIWRRWLGASDGLGASNRHLTHLGRLTLGEAARPQLLFLPQNGSQEPIDFTGNLLRHELSSPKCIGCGCTEDVACVSSGTPCHWLKVDRDNGIGLCSNCPGHLDKFTELSTAGRKERGV